MFFEVEWPALSAWTVGAEQAARVSQPVLSVLGAETERLWVEVADHLRRWFAQVEECRIAGVGHLLHAEPLGACLVGFFAGHPLRHREVPSAAAAA